MCFFMKDNKTCKLLMKLQLSHYLKNSTHCQNGWSNTIVLFIKVAPGGKSELERAGTCATRSNDNRVTRASSPDWRCGIRWQFRLARARSCTTKMRRSRWGKLKLWWKLEQGGLAMLRPAASWRHVGSRASGLVKQELAVSWQVRARNLRNKSSDLGMEHPGAAGSGELKTCGGDVVEAGAGAILNNLGPTGLLIYPLGLEEWPRSRLLELQMAEWWVNGRAELVARRHQVGTSVSVIEGKN